ncbi:hypothetical protein FGB62_209g010 [Gracilaria domingensis]|nr:hypothetical protein FGB62_209g010 [Gracilaria domingensis]
MGRVRHGCRRRGDRRVSGGRWDGGGNVNVDQRRTEHAARIAARQNGGVCDGSKSNAPARRMLYGLQ